VQINELIQRSGGQNRVGHCLLLGNRRFHGLCIELDNSFETVEEFGCAIEGGFDDSRAFTQGKRVQGNEVHGGSLMVGWRSIIASRIPNSVLSQTAGWARLLRNVWHGGSLFVTPIHFAG
jgi:hypothetical protein